MESKISYNHNHKNIVYLICKILKCNISQWSLPQSSNNNSFLFEAYKIVEKALCERKKQRNNCLMRPCPMILRPICAFDGKVQKVFDNQCVMEIENCIHGNSE